MAGAATRTLSQARFLQGSVAIGNDPRAECGADTVGLNYALQGRGVVAVNLSSEIGRASPFRHGSLDRRAVSERAASKGPVVTFASWRQGRLSHGKLRNMSQLEPDSELRA